MDNSWAKPGIRCVCIDDDWSMTPPKKLQCAEYLPEAGHRYTIRRVRFYAGHGTFLLFEEIRNPPVQYGQWNGEPQFAAERFRPLVTPTQEQDIALFASILYGQPVEV